MPSVVKTLAIAGISSLLVSTLAQASVVITATQNVTGVQITISGGIDTTGLLGAMGLIDMTIAGIDTVAGTLVSQETSSGFLAYRGTPNFIL